ncbi:MAG: hypothetical protein M3436_00705 [Pseudomonadota bacterium]|nr:hypothetical protein [Pseudomonadota bacterium]
MCAESFELQVHACGEGKYIRASAEPDETFRAFVLRIRAGDNTVSIRRFSV